MVCCYLVYDNGQQINTTKEKGNIMVKFLENNNSQWTVLFTFIMFSMFVAGNTLVLQVLPMVFAIALLIVTAPAYLLTGVLLLMVVKGDTFADMLGDD